MSLDGSDPTGAASVDTGAAAPTVAAGSSTLVHAGTAISVDNTDPLNPVVANTGVKSFMGSTGAITSQFPILDTVNTSGNMLSALASASLGAGSMVYVSSFPDFFVLKQSALTVDHINVETASGKAGYQWLRMLMPPPSNAAITAWSVDTTSGSDENVGTTDATALKTLQELKRRLWGLPLSVTATVRILTDTASTDTGVWNTKFIGAGFLLFQGVLGPSTGPGPTAHDNTIYSGSVTAVNVPANTPSADEYTITDSAIPVSYTASGMLATGILFKRTSSTNLNWFALKDNGSKTIRVTNPMNNTGASTWTPLAVNDTYTAFQAVKVYAQDFGDWALNVRFDSVDDEGTATQVPGFGCQYRRAYRSGASKGIVAGLHVNCLINVTSGTGQVFSRGELETVPQFNGGGYKGTGTNALNFLTGHYGLTGIYVCEGLSIVALDGAYVTLESESATHDFTGGANTANYVSKGASAILFQIAQAGQGISGKGNTGKLLQVTQQGTFGYALGGATPPFTGASTTDASPIVIGGSAFAVSSMPAALETVLTPSTFKNTLP